MADERPAWSGAKQNPFSECRRRSCWELPRVLRSRMAMPDASITDASTPRLNTWELEVGSWRFGVNRLPAELNGEARGGPVKTIAQDVGLRGLAVADATAHADRLRDARRDVRLRLE